MIFDKNFKVHKGHNCNICVCHDCGYGSCDKNFLHKVLEKKPSKYKKVNKYFKDNRIFYFPCQSANNVLEHFQNINKILTCNKLDIE